MNDFIRRIKAMTKTKEKSDESKEKLFGNNEIIVVKDTKNQNIFVCIRESLGKMKESVVKVRANNIEDGTEVAEYRLNALPAGRVCFGGYTNKECNEGKKIYSFEDAWYKIYGMPIQAGRKFTRSELQDLVQEIRTKLRNAKFTHLYSIRYKKSAHGKKGFEGSKYFGGYLIEGHEEEQFETINDDSIRIQTVEDNRDGNLIITVGNQEIDTKSSVLNGVVREPKESEFEIELIEGLGVSKVYSRAKFTKDACRQIIRDYEKEKGIDR